MEKNFTIEVEVDESEKKNYIEKLCELFLKKGFVVEREWEENIELNRPLSGKDPEGVMMFPWIDRVYIQGKSGSVVVNCSTKHFIWFRYLILYVVPIVDVLFLLLLYFLINFRERFILIPIFVVMIVSNVFIYFIMSMQYKRMISLLAEEIQNL